MAAAGCFSSRALCCAAVLLLVAVRLSEGREYLVGGKMDSWKIPSSESESLNHWAESSRFLIGDSLVWKYDSSKDSVAEVSKKDYENCNTSSPIAEYKDGNTKVTLDRSGPFYFISGAAGHCEKGQKLAVVVISPRRHRSIAPAPAPVEGPAVAPTSAAVGSESGLVVGLAVLASFLALYM